MRKNLLILLIAVIFCIGVINAGPSQKKDTITVDESETTFDDFKKNFGKKYGNSEEVAVRQANFEANLIKLKASECTACGVTSLFDLSQEELAQKRGLIVGQIPNDSSMKNLGLSIAQEAKGNGLRSEVPDMRPVPVPTPTSGQVQGKSSSGSSGSSSTVPTIAATILDWRNSNVVTPVKDQGACGSCWAFASIAFFESQLARTGRTDNTVNLAEQFPLNCDTGSSGCNGGSCVSAGRLLISKGARLNTTYPYSPSTTYPGICSSTADLALSGTLAYYASSTRKLTETQLISYLTVRPIVVYIYASTFYLYKPATTRTFQCSKTDSTSYSKLNHAVLMVGYTDTEWIIKNSWGPNWGASGYIYVSRNSAYNCGIGYFITTLA